MLIFVTLSWPRFLILSRTSDAMQVILLVSLSVKWYICLSRDSNPLSDDPEALSWTKHVDQTSASCLYNENDQYNEHIPCVVVVVCSGLTSLSTIFQPYHDGVWLRQGAQCSLLLCCVTEVSCPRHLTWYHTQSHYPDTASTSPSSSSQVLVLSEEQLVPFLKTLVCRGPGSNPWPQLFRSGHSTD